MRKVAVILFNLGGPDRPEAVRPFLYNLFSDPAIIAAPQPFRTLIAGLISTTRERTAKATYARIGGASPLLGETKIQAAALQDRLDSLLPNTELRAFIAMRYWRPFAAEAAAEARAWGATEALLAPLYPQFSSTTTGSAMLAWSKVWSMPTQALCCYPRGEKFAAAHAAAILDAWKAAGSPPKPRVLFSAHGLPKSIVDRGDPYQWQVEQSVAAVRPLLPADWEIRTCYQSRVGPMQWIGPSTLEEIAAAERDRVGIIVSPIAFVSEHVETLVELDIDYAERARALPFYIRAKALGPAPLFIDELAEKIRRTLSDPRPIASAEGGRLCPVEFAMCPLKA